MKNILLGVSLLISTYTFSQWNNNGDNSTTGTLTFEGKSIKMYIPTTSGGWARGISLYNPDGSTRFAGIGLHGNSGTPKNIYLAHGENPYSSGLGIYINSSGNVGIKNTNPTRQFQINGSVNGGTYTAMFNEYNNYINNAIFESFDNNDGGRFVFRSSKTAGSTDVMVIDRFGKVGIGTASPSAKLDISHNSERKVLISPENQLDVTGSSSITIKEFVPSIEFADASSGANSGLVFANRNKLFIGKKSGAAITESSLFNVDLNSGNVGIGTTTPEDKLFIKDGDVNIRGLNTSRYLRFTENEHQGAFINYNGTENILNLGTVNTTTSTDITAEYNAISIVRSNGNVGIGSSSPEDKLFIKDGDVNIRGLNTSRYLRFTEIENEHQGAFINYDGNENVFNIGVMEAHSSDLTQEKKVISIVRSNGNVGIGDTSPTETLTVKKQGVTIGIYDTHPLSEANNRIARYGKSLVIQNDLGGQWSDNVNFLDNGDVGIGTKDTKGFKLGVKGKIAAEEIKVAVYPWADFVFKKEYKLPTLKEVETHIKEKGHLKDIPSAKEVEKNGVYLGQMDAKLLQKIEELTLYTIQQEKQIQELKKQTQEIEKLKALVNQLLKEKTK